MFELIKDLHEGFHKLPLLSTEVLTYFEKHGIRLLSTNGVCTGAVYNTEDKRKFLFQLGFKNGSILRCENYFAHTGTSEHNVECCIVNHKTDDTSKLEEILILSTEDFMVLDDDTIFQYCTMYKDFEDFYKSFVYTNKHNIFVHMDTIIMKMIIETINKYLCLTH